MTISAATKRQRLNEPINHLNINNLASPIKHEIFSNFIFFGTGRDIDWKELRTLRFVCKMWRDSVQNCLTLSLNQMTHYMSGNVWQLKTKRIIFPKLEQLFVRGYEADCFLKPLKAPNLRVLHAPALPFVIEALAFLPGLEELNLDITGGAYHEQNFTNHRGTQLFISALDNCRKANAQLKTIYLEDRNDHPYEGAFQNDTSLEHLGNTYASQLTKIVWRTSGNAAFSHEALRDLAKKCSKLEYLQVETYLNPSDEPLIHRHLMSFAQECPTLTEIQYSGNYDDDEIESYQLFDLFYDHTDLSTNFPNLINLKKLEIKNVMPSASLLSNISLHCPALQSLSLSIVNINDVPKSLRSKVHIIDNDGDSYTLNQSKA